MIIETDDIMLGIAWNIEEADEILLDSHGEEAITLPIIILAIDAEDEETALSKWRERYPHLTVDKVVPLNTLIDEGAVS